MLRKVIKIVLSQSVCSSSCDLLPVLVQGLGGAFSELFRTGDFLEGDFLLVYWDMKLTFELVFNGIRCRMVENMTKVNVALVLLWAVRGGHEGRH